MKRILYFILASLLISGSATAGVLLTVENRSLDGTGPEVVVSKIAIEGKRVRIDHDGPNKSGRGSVIYRGDEKQMIVLDHQGNSFQILTKDSLKRMNQQMSAMMKQMEAKLAQLPPAQRKMVEQMMQQESPALLRPPAAPKSRVLEVKKTSVTQKLRGYATVRYDVYENGDRVREMWVTDWAGAGVERETFRVFKEMHQFQQEAFASMNRPQGFQGSDAAFDEFRQVDGLPIIVTSFRGNTKARETTLQSLEKKDFDEAYFAPPSGYTESGGFGK